MHKPSVRLIAQPDTLKLIAAESFKLPRARENREGNLLPVDSQQTAEKSSENSLFNSIIHGITRGERADVEEVVEEAPPQAADVPQPAFPAEQNSGLGLHPFFILDSLQKKFILFKKPNTCEVPPAPANPPAAPAVTE